MHIIDHPSPNHGPRPEGIPIDMVILHYTGMVTGEAALERLCCREAEVSAHYLIEEDGRVFALVPEERRAWHAGRSFWKGNRDTNSRSIGIEIVNPGHEWGYRDFPEDQLVALETLLAAISSRHVIPQAHYLAHSDVAPERKEDPGERFPWARLAGKGYGLWPRVAPLGDDQNVQEYLAAVGYDMDFAAQSSDAMKKVVTAFQRHFVPERIGTDGEGEADNVTVARARWLAEKVKNCEEGL